MPFALATRYLPNVRSSPKFNAEEKDKIQKFFFLFGFLFGILPTSLLILLTFHDNLLTLRSFVSGITDGLQHKTRCTPRLIS